MTKRIGLVYAIALVLLLATPTIVWLGAGQSALPLYGYVDKIPERPAAPLAAFFDRRLQVWAERYFNLHFGLRPALIRSFNELTFRVFHELPRLRVYSTPQQGLYSGQSLEYLNQEILRKQALEQEYAARAQTWKKVQSLLEAQGKAFVVVIASSKPYVYPDSLGERYLAGGNADVYGRAASFGAALKRAGVNVIDSAPLLRAFGRATNIATHPDSGLHWNYYAGCQVAQQLMDRVRSRYPATQPFGCGLPQYAAPHMVDIDGLSLMNIWSGGGVRHDAPYPTAVAADAAAWRPSFVFISDSFGDQILYPLQQGHAYAKAVNSGYFRARSVDDSGAGLRVTHDLGADWSAVRSQLYEDIRQSDVVVLQTVDYNISNYGYDFPEHLLSDYRPAAQARPAPAVASPTPVPLNVLGFAEVGNRANPFMVPTRLHLAASVADLLATVPSAQWDVIAVLQNASRRDPRLAAELERRGYLVAVDSEQGLLALPRARGALPKPLGSAQLQWTAFNQRQDARLALVDNLPSIESAQPADLGYATQPLALGQPTLIRASFAGTIAGTGEHAAHLSMDGGRIIFSLPAGTYSAEQEQFAIVPAQAAGRQVRLWFGLGGWATGSGKLRLTRLELRPLQPGGPRPQ